MNREEKRKRLAAFKEGTDLPLKESGVVAEVGPAPMAAWIIAGEVPESLFGSAMSAIQSGPAATVEALKLPDVFGLAIKVAYGTFKWPSLTPQDEPQAKAKGDDELNPYTLPLPDLSVVLAWGLTGKKDATVQTDSGEVPAEDLHSFREDAGLQGSSQNGGPIQGESGAALLGHSAQ